MSTNAMPPPKTAHPAPHRNRVGLAALLFGIAAAPLAWNAQVLSGAALAGSLCYPHAAPLAAPLWAGSRSIMLAISIAGMLMAISAGLVARRSWRRTSDERPGSVHHLLELGEGRTRFLAMVGMLTSTLFLIALVFETTALCIVPLCGG